MRITLRNDRIKEDYELMIMGEWPCNNGADTEYISKTNAKENLAKRHNLSVRQIARIVKGI